MKITARVTINTVVPGLQSASKRVHAELSKAVRETAFEIQNKAQEDAAVDTGAMKNSTFVKTSEFDGYEQAVTMAAGAYAEKHPGEAFPAHDQGETDEVTSDLKAIVAVAAKYAYYVEYGTEHMGAQPFIGPAADEYYPKFIGRVRRAIKDGVNAT